MNDNQDCQNTIKNAYEKWKSNFDDTDDLIKTCIWDKHSQDYDVPKAETQVNHDNPVKKGFSFLLQYKFHYGSIEKDDK